MDMFHDIYRGREETGVLVRGPPVIEWEVGSSAQCEGRQEDGGRRVEGVCPSLQGSVLTIQTEQTEFLASAPLGGSHVFLTMVA